MKAKIHITLKSGILDPQGKTILHALSMLGISGVEEVRVGKLIEMTLAGVSRDHAQALADEACRKLLANPVIEGYSLTVIDD